MRAIVDEEACTGCGLCPQTCPEVFEMASAGGEEKAIVLVDVVPAECEESCREAMEGCPVEAISLE